MTLPPTIHERLARCNEQVYIDGLIPGAVIELFIDSDRIEFVAATNAQTLNVTPLNAGSVLRARQNSGGGFTPFSANVIVEGCCQSNAIQSPASNGIGAVIQPEVGAIRRGRRFSWI